ncbi:MAG: DUF1415 domain-containing protein [Ginsengibacter sp.]
MATTQLVISQTKRWINNVVVGCNFCPFAAREIKQNAVHYEVENSIETGKCLSTFLNECRRLDIEKNMATTLVIFPNAFKRFDNFLDAVALAEELILREGYEGIYQVASFHPLYCFANALVDDAANYTNRSVYPMLHLLREDQIEEALLHYSSPEDIPENNIRFAREKGLVYMKMLRDACL